MKGTEKVSAIQKFLKVCFGITVKGCAAVLMAGFVLLLVVVAGIGFLILTDDERESDFVLVETERSLPLVTLLELLTTVGGSAEVLPTECVAAVSSDGCVDDKAFVKRYDMNRDDKDELIVLDQKPKHWESNEWDKSCRWVVFAQDGEVWRKAGIMMGELRGRTDGGDGMFALQANRRNGATLTYYELVGFKVVSKRLFEVKYAN